MLKLLFAATAAAALLSSQALADGVSTQTVTLRVDRVNFDNPAQVEALYAHIRVAAREACIEPPDPALPSIPADWDCVNHMVAEAVAKIGQPRLTALYDQAPASSPRGVLAGNDQ
jgi:UrcA family protein